MNACMLLLSLTACGDPSGYPPRPPLPPASLPPARVVASSDIATTNSPPPSGSFVRVAYACESAIGDLPKVWPLIHRYVAVCPPGELPTVTWKGTPYGNPACSAWGTWRGTERFERQPGARDAVCRPALLPAAVVEARLLDYDKPYRLRTENCCHSTAYATGIALATPTQASGTLLPQLSPPRASNHRLGEFVFPKSTLTPPVVSAIPTAVAPPAWHPPLVLPKNAPPATGGKVPVKKYTKQHGADLPRV